MNLSLKSKKRILVVSQVFPYPAHDGGRFDVYHRLKALKSLDYEIDLIAFYNPQFPDLSLEPLLSCCKNVYPIPVLRRKLSKVFHWKPYFIGSKENHVKIEEILDEIKNNPHYNFIFAESHHVLSVTALIKSRLNIDKVYLRVHNNESKLMKGLSKCFGYASYKGLFFLAESIKTNLYETLLFKSKKAPAKLLHISLDELHAYKMKWPALNHTFLPAAIDLSSSVKYKKSKEQIVLFVGALAAPNNIQGLDWYLKNVHPHLIQTFPNYQLCVAGNVNGVTKEQLDLIKNNQSVTLIETPDDLNPIYKKARVFINPMRYGAGVKLKNLDAIKNALPVVTTTVGNQGTGFISKKHLFVADSKDEYIESISQLLKDDLECEQLVKNSQNYLNEHFDHAKNLDRIFNE